MKIKLTSWQCSVFSVYCRSDPSIAQIAKQNISRYTLLICLVMFENVRVWKPYIWGEWVIHLTDQTRLSSSLSHYSDVIMSVMASQITGVSIVYSSLCPAADQRKHQSSASLAFVGEFTGDQWPLWWEFTYHRTVPWPPPHPKFQRCGALMISL